MADTQPSPAGPDSSSRGAAALTLGFGTAVAMWVVGFVARIPPAALPGSALLALMLLVLLAGGARAGRLPGGGAGLGALTGLVAGAINLLLLGSLLNSSADSASPQAWIWAPGWLVAAAGLGAVGGAIGRGFRSPPDSPDWTSELAKVASLATLVLVAVGGAVTSHEAGLAVVDWPNSYGYNMFLFPISRMVGGVFYEHSHRLFGSLIGLITLVLTIRVFATERRGWVKTFAVGLLLLVIGQGILGGLRVTGHFTLSDSAEVTRPNLGLALLHGVTGQIFLAGIVAMAAVTSRTWKAGPLQAGRSAERSAPFVLVAFLLVQLILGVRLRHLGEGLWAHLMFSIAVVMMGMAAALRTAALFGTVPVLRTTSRALFVLIATQFSLGIAALIAVNHTPEAPPGTWEVVAATAHQTTGALLLAAAVLLAVWHRRVAAVSTGTAPLTSETS